MKRIASATALLMLLLINCRDNSLSAIRLLDLKTFRVEVPATWKDIPGQGFDSQVGRLTNGFVTLTYDYGWHAYSLQKETSATHFRTVTAIGGRPALIVRPRKTGKGLIGLYVEVDSRNRLNLIGHDLTDEKTIIQIFESVRL